MHMVDAHISKRLLVCAPAQGSRATGGQKLRWRDIVDKDLKHLWVAKIMAR